MTELFNDLVIVGDAIEEEDRVAYLLASLPDSFNTLATACGSLQDGSCDRVIATCREKGERKIKR